MYFPDSTGRRKIGHSISNAARAVTRKSSRVLKDGVAEHDASDFSEFKPCSDTWSVIPGPPSPAVSPKESRRGTRERRRKRKTRRKKRMLSRTRRVSHKATCFDN